GAPTAARRRRARIRAGGIANRAARPGDGAVSAHARRAGAARNDERHASRLRIQARGTNRRPWRWAAAIFLDLLLRVEPCHVYPSNDGEPIRARAVWAVAHVGDALVCRNRRRA